MKIKQVKFLQCVVDWTKCPTGALPEYAFIGRSNVGKSSLINMLANNSSLAKISGKPGKTQTINHFLVDNNWYLVDLPGYGYASIAKSTREKWITMIDEYFTNRPNLQLVFVLIDSRLSPQTIDIDFINKLGSNGIPFSIIFTKTDKISAKQTEENRTLFCNKLLETWEELPPLFISSAINGKGREEICEYIDQINQVYYQEHTI